MSNTYDPNEAVRELAARRAFIASKPKIHFVWQRAWECAPDMWRIGVYWGRDLDAPEGTMIYRRRWTLLVKFRLSIDQR